jgi:catalase
VYAPNSYGGPRADIARHGEPAGWHADGDMVQPPPPCTPKTTTGVSEPVLLRAVEYLRNVDKDLGDRVEKGVRAGGVLTVSA